MNVLISWSFSYSQLICLSVFFCYNLSTLEEPGGKFFLIASFALSTVLIILFYFQSFISRVTHSFLMLSAFLFYFLLNYIWDSQNLSQVKEITIGTSGGVIFAVLSGLFSAISLSTLYKAIEDNKIYLFLSKWTFLFASFFCLLLCLKVFLETTSNVRSDIFLIQDQSGKYQRPGNLMLMLFMLLSSIFAMLQVRLRAHRFWGLTSLFVLSALSCILMAQSQLIGSNSGLVTIAAMMLMLWCYWLLIGSKEFSLTLKHIRISNVFFGWVTGKLIIYLIFISSIGVVIIYFILNRLNIDVAMFRIFGFGSGDVSSFDSRLKLLKENFMTQLEYNPIFGHTLVDKLTTGSGTYTHSLLSILTHLGVFGFILFLLMILFIYKDIYSFRSRKLSLYDQKEYALFRLFALSSVIVFCILTAFYTWMPLWFAIGLVGVSMPTWNQKSLNRFIKVKN